MSLSVCVCSQVEILFSATSDQQVDFKFWIFKWMDFLIFESKDTQQRQIGKHQKMV